MYVFIHELSRQMCNCSFTCSKRFISKSKDNSRHSCEKSVLQLYIRTNIDIYTHVGVIDVNFYYSRQNPLMSLNQ